MEKTLWVEFFNMFLMIMPLKFIFRKNIFLHLTGIKYTGSSIDFYNDAINHKLQKRTSVL